MELRLNSSASECTSSDGNEELLERVLRDFVPRSRSRRHQQEFLEKKEEVRANDEEEDDDNNYNNTNIDNTNNSDSINAMIKDVNLIDVSGIQLKETTKTKTSETSTSLAELHQQRENERVRSLAQTSSEAVRSAVLEWSAHKQNVFLKRFATQASDDAVLELNLSSWTDTNNNSVRDEKQFFRDYTNINRNVEDRTPGTPNRASSLRSKSMNIDIDALFRNEDKFGEERLQELENASSQKTTSKDVARTTQRDCVERLQKLNDNIAHAWLEADRVAALKLSIKVVKLLGYNAGGKAPEFYPTLFFLVTDIADTVGRLVYKRIKAKAENKSEETYDDEINDDIENTSTGRKKLILPENWNSDDIRDSAKATCRNWFFKVASIRELVPRLYLEFALLDCMRFLRPEPPVDRLNRLIAQIKGVGDPLVSAYLRCYAAKKIATVLPEKFQKDALKTLLGDFISRYVVINDIDESNTNNASAAMRRSGLKKDVLVRLMHPSLAWILSRNIKLAESSTLERSIQMCSNEFKGKPPLSFLSALFETLSEEVCAENAMRLVRLVKDSSSSCNLEEDVCDCAKCFVVLGKAFARVPPQEQYRLDVLMEVWKVLGKWNEDQLEHYAGVTDAFVDFVAENFTRSQLEILLKDLAKRVRKSRAKFFDGDEELASRRKIQAGNLAKNIENICTTILFRFEDISLALSLSGFSYLVDQLGGQSKVQFSRKLLERIGKSKHRLEGSSVINHAFEGAKAVHDSVDALALRTGSLAEVDESITLFDLVTSFVSKVHFEEANVDGELRFLMNCRSAFTNADGALIKVVQRAIAIVKRCITEDVKNNEKTKAQAASSVAFCQITIPSVENIEARLDLIVETAKYATVCELHAQVDGVISSAIQDIEEAIETLRAERVHAFVAKLSEVLMDNPAGHPEYGSFYAIATASTMLEKMTTDTGCYKAYAYLALAYVVAAFAETCGTLNKKNVELFGGSEQAFIDECCSWTKEMVSKAADVVAFNESPTTKSAEANLRIACAVFDLFKRDSKETKKTIQTLVRRAEASEMISKDDNDSDLLRAHRVLKEMCSY